VGGPLQQPETSITSNADFACWERGKGRCEREAEYPYSTPRPCIGVLPSCLGGGRFLKPSASLSQ